MSKRIRSAFLDGVAVGQNREKLAMQLKEARRTIRELTADAERIETEIGEVENHIRKYGEDDDA